MKLGMSLCMLAVLLACARAHAQLPEPGVWWAISPDAPIDERVQITATPNGPVIASVRIGKAPVNWGPIVPHPDGTIEFSYSGDQLRLCTLKRTEHATYVGSCQGSLAGPLTLARRGNPGGLEVAVGEQEFQILTRARQLLSSASVWNRSDDRVCEDSRAKKSWSLYCALDQASIDVAGVDLVVRPVMEEARAAVIEVADRKFNGALKDFNNLESTTYSDIVKVFDVTERRLRTMQACVRSPDASAFIIGPRAEKTDSETVMYWFERIGYTVNGKTYDLTNYLGRMGQRDDIPADWVAASTSVTRRDVRHDARYAADVKGTLPDGLQWRYAHLCGESLIYHDVPPEAATYFDRLIDAAYFQGVRLPKGP